MHAIEVVDLRKSYASSEAVQGICFAVEPGTLTVILGPSGCGKSTTLRLIAGLETANSGKILIGGRDVTACPPAQRSLSMVFQSYALFPHLTVAENIVFGLRVRRVAAAERTRRLQKAASLLGLQQLLERKPSQLSGGQQQRVALGRAIIAETPVCLMDEPLSNLDAQLRQEMRTEIRSLQKKLGITMVYVTHDQIEAMSLADQVIVMRGGRIEQATTPSALYGRPQTSFVAGFVGTPPMNLIRLQDSDAGAIVAGTPGPAVFEGGGADILLGVRPEDLTIDNDVGLVDATVTSAEYHGADTVISVRIGTELVLVRKNGEVRAQAGECVRVGWAAAAMHAFDQKSGQRLTRSELVTRCDAKLRLLAAR
jgi:sn-glycerol 3-phosphate transport system ATP-binding protein